MHIPQTFCDDDKQTPNMSKETDMNAAQRKEEDKSKVDESVEEVSPSLWENDGWELTWPIWHMLPRDEKKTIAKRHGYTTIGEFEENMALQKALGQTGEGMAALKIGGDLDAKEESSTSKEETTHLQPDATTTATNLTATVADIPADNSDSDDEPEEELIENEEELTGEQAIQLAGTIMILHEELLHSVFAYLPVDMFGTLALVSPHWKYMTRTESVYKRLCERLYLNQSKKKQLHVSRFGNSYRRMLEIRPRVRTAGGCYVLKYAQVKQIQRDMWTEIPIGAILETIYYRYLYFQEDGRVLYALTSAAPHIMMPRLLKVCMQKTNDAAAVWGNYQVQKNALSVSAKQAWTNVKFDLTIQNQSYYGRFAALTLNRHLTSQTGCFDDWSYDLVEYKVPDEQFRFVHSSRL